MKLKRMAAAIGTATLALGLAGGTGAMAAGAAEPVSVQPTVRAALQGSYAGVSAGVDSVDVPGQSAVLSGRGQPGAVLNIHPQGDPVSFVRDIPVAADGTWRVTVAGLPVGTNNLLIDQRVPSEPTYLGRGYATVIITPPSVVVHHVAAGTGLAPDVVVSGTPGAGYTVAPAAVPGYHVDSVTPAASGTYGRAGSVAEVTFAYARDKGVIVTEFLDGSGRALADPVRESGLSGDRCATSAAVVDGWHVVSAPAVTCAYPSHGSTTTVRYVYGPDRGEVVTRYVDEAGDDVAPVSAAQSGLTGSAYTTEPITVRGYHLVEAPSDAQGVFPADSTTTTVRYTYSPDLGTVVTRFVDVDGAAVAAPVFTTGRSGGPYTTSPAEVPLHHLVDTPSGATGEFPAHRESVTVTYRYAHDRGTVVIRYVDGNGVDVAAPDAVVGDTGSPYSTSPTSVRGLHVVDEPATAVGLLPAHGTTTTVVYTYAQDMGAVTTHFVDENEVELADPVSATGPSGTRYTTAAALIAGYHPVALPDNAGGLFPADGRTVDVRYRYAPDMGTVVTRFVDWRGHEIAPEQPRTGRTDAPYTIVPVPVAGHHVVAQSPRTGTYPADGCTVVVELVYARDTGTVVARFVDAAGRELSPPVMQAGDPGKAYETRAARVPGYVVTGSPESAAGTFGADGSTIEVVYVYVPDETFVPPVMPVIEPPLGPSPSLPDRSANEVRGDRSADTAGTPRVGTPEHMAQTGSDAAAVGALAVVLMVGGAAAVVLAARRRSTQEH